MKKLISLLLVAVTVLTMVSFAITAFAKESNTVSIAETLPTTESVTETTSVNSTDETTESSTAFVTEATTEPTEETTSAFETSSETTSTVETTEVTDATVETTVEVTQETTVDSETTEPTTEEPTETQVTTEATEATESTAIVTTTPTEPATKPTTATEPTTVKKLYPSPVKNFKVAKKSTSAIKLTWTKSTKNTTHYVIYRSAETSNGKFTAYKKLKTISDIKKTTFTDKKLKSGYVYKYKIFAYNKTKTYTTHSSASAVKTVVKMLAPKVVKVKKATTSYISIKWSKVSGAKKYYVYRKAGDGQTVLIAKTKTNSYVDKKVTTGGNYKYKIKGYRVVNKKVYAGPGKVVSAAAGITGVSGVTAKSYLKRALLTWTPVTGADGYDVFVLNSKGNYVLKETRAYPSYLSGKTKVGKTYKFAIKAFKKVSGNKSYSGTKTVKVTITDDAYGKTPSGTWVEVCLETQQMFMFVNNKLYCKTSVVTGTGVSGPLSTKRGYHQVISKKSPAQLRGSYGSSSWDVKVSFWLGFTSDGQGIHDSTWRTSGYGGEIYKNNGSHGCVNTPYAAASKIYSKAFMGMPVIVY